MGIKYSLSYYTHTETKTLLAKNKGELISWVGLALKNYAKHIEIEVLS